MLTRRQMLTRTLKGSSILALGNGLVVPRFLANTAQAADAGDTTLVIIEMTGGNDGLNMVIPYGDDLYHKARPTLRYTKEKVIKVDDYLGLHPSLAGLDPLLKNNELAIVQGVGYPNPNRSHFESMDVWQAGDLRGAQTKEGWVARSGGHLQAQRGGVPALQVGPEKLPLALRGADKAVASINNQMPLQFKWGAANPKDENDRKKFLIEMVGQERPKKDESLLDFVQRQQLQTYSRLDELQKLLENRGQDGRFPQTPLGQKMQLVGQLIERGFGMRVFYMALDGFDTHSGQIAAHEKLFSELSGAIGALFNALKPNGHDKRVMVMTYSEFGRRIAENSGGTDHGAASCLFVAGPGVKGGPVNKHPSLKDTDQGDLKHHTDFRRVYATILDGWLKIESKAILGEKFEHLEFLKG